MIPDELKNYKQWVCWKYITVDGRKTKVPVTPNAGRRARSNDAKTWGTYDEALEMSKYYDGIGFVFTKDDPFVGIDIDHCMKGKNLLPFAKTLIKSCNSYTEFSPSGNGIHIIGKGKMPFSTSGKRTEVIEIYESMRFFTVTGNRLEDVPCEIQNIQPMIDALFEKYFKKEEVSVDTKDFDVYFDPEAAMDSDIEFLQMVLFRQKDGNLLRALYNGENPMRGGDRSYNDYYFCLKVNWANRNNLAQTDRIFRSSGRMRPKWDKVHYSSGETYGQKLLKDSVSRNPKGLRKKG